MDHSGLASLDDILLSEWERVFNYLEQIQDEFLSHEQEFRSPEYCWPHDALHNWSRYWEYPYTFHNLQKFFSSKEDHGSKQILDFGCGTTFFPFAVARQGFNVIGVDIDSVTENDFNKASSLIPTAPGGVRFKKTDGFAIPQENESVDAVYCISVLEHIPHKLEIIDEITRILKDNGLFILTIDIDLRGNYEIGSLEFNHLMTKIRETFTFFVPEETIHPTRILTSTNSLYPLNNHWLLTNQFAYPIVTNMGRVFFKKNYQPIELACLGLVLQKKI